MPRSQDPRRYLISRRGAAECARFVFVQYPWRSSLGSRRTSDRLWATVSTPLSRGLFEFGSLFVERSYSERRLQSERYLMRVCREWRLVRRVMLELCKGLRYDIQVGQLVSSQHALKRLVTRSSRAVIPSSRSCPIWLKRPM